MEVMAGALSDDFVEEDYPSARRFKFCEFMLEQSLSMLCIRRSGNQGQECSDGL